MEEKKKKKRVAFMEEVIGDGGDNEDGEQGERGEGEGTVMSLMVDYTVAMIMLMRG